MAMLERRWWLRLIGALLAVTTALIFALWYFGSMLPNDRRTGVPAITDALLAFDITALLLGVAFHEVVKALLAHRRSERLTTAIDGYQDALPLASVAADDVTSTAIDHVVASWPHPRSAVVMEALFLLVFVGIVCFTGVWLAFIILLLLHAPVPEWLVTVIQWSRPSSPRRGTTPTLHVPFATEALLGILLLGSPILIVLPLLPAAFAAIICHPSRIEADAEGLTWHSVWGLRRLIRWRDVRLLEIATYTARQNQNGPPRTYWLWTLYSERSSIRWQQPADVPGPATDSFTYVMRSVIAYTHLQPRTLDPGLLAPGETLPRTFLDRIDARLTPRLSSVAVIIVTVILPVGLIYPVLLVGGVTILGVSIILTLISKLLAWWQRSKGRGSPPTLALTGGVPLTFEPGEKVGQNRCQVATNVCLVSGNASRDL